MHIDFHKSFFKDLRKLHKKIRTQFVERKRIFVENPFDPLLHNHALSGVFEGCYSINVTGNVRAIYSMRGERVVFLHIGTHSEL